MKLTSSFFAFSALALAPCVPAATPTAGDGVRLNTVGYTPEARKAATVVGASGVESFSIVETASGNVVFSGRLSDEQDSPQTRERARIADFSALQQNGVYLLRVPGLPDSAPFRVDAHALNRSLEAIMIGFYGQRCNEAVTLTWNGDTFAHAACHLQDGFLDYNDPARKGQIKPSLKGWHDAGDYGKYTLNAAFSTGLMLLAWEHRSEVLAKLELPFLPEHGGSLPDFLDEVKFNLDWLLTMQMENGEAAHKLTSLGFGGMILPQEDKAPRFFTPNDRASTLSFAAVGFMAARTFRPYDASYADTWLAAAKRAWSAAQTMPDAHPDTSAFKTGAYFTNPAGYYRWALAEARLALGEAGLSPAQLAAFQSWVASDQSVFERVWDWGNGGNLGLYSWLFSSEAKRYPESYDKLRADLLRAADEIVANSRQHAYGRGVARYAWGGNGLIARSTTHLYSAYRLTGDAKYLDALSDQVAYLYGRNPYARSFVTGDGHQPPLHPHHRPSAGDKVEAPWPGHLVGGAKQIETDWKDETASYDTNETAINWDAALAYALAVFYRP